MPRWLFDRMVDLSGAIAEVIVDEYGQDELLRRLADPHWFQAFGCVLGFDWHSSGLTTTTMGALKEALDAERHGVVVAGGKGATSRKTPDELAETPLALSGRSRDTAQYASRLSATVDNACVQDDYTLYHHTTVVAEGGQWAVVQQGNDDPAHLKRYFASPGQSSLDQFADGGTGSTPDLPHLKMPTQHELRPADLTDRTIDQLQNAYEVQPDDYEELVGIDGIGPKSLRALALISEVVHDAETSREDPAKYAYAHGGKDGTPHPVDRERYDRSIDYMRDVLQQTDVETDTRQTALDRLATLQAEEP